MSRLLYGLKTKVTFVLNESTPKETAAAMS
jgi:hypothetical protein